MSEPWEDFKPQAPPAPADEPWLDFKPSVNAVDDAGYQFDVGLKRGVIGAPGLPADVAGLIQSGVDWGTRKVTGKSQDEIDKGRLGGMIGSREGLAKYGSANIIDNVDKIAPNLDLKRQAQTTAGRYAGAVGEALPLAAVGGAAGLPARLGYGAISGLGGEGGADAAKSFLGAKEGSGLQTAGRVIGSIVAPFGAAGAVKGLQPYTAERLTPSHQRAVADLDREGVSMTAGERLNNTDLRYAEDTKGGSRAQAAHERSAEEYTSAALGRINTAGRTEPEVMQRARDAIVGQFEDLSTRHQIIPDRALAADLNRVMTEYQSVTGPSSMRPVVGNTIDDIVGQIRASPTGTIAGDWYQSQRSRLSKLAQSSRISDPDRAEALRGLRNALDDSMERSIANVAPEDLGLWRETRRLYGNLKTMEHASGSGTGANAADSLVSPAKLRSSITRDDYGKRQYAYGQGDFADLARAGNKVFAPLPNSGTPQRLAAMVQPAMIGGAMASAAGGNFLPLAGAVGAIAGPRLSGRALMSRPVQNLLAAQLLGEHGVRLPDATRAALAQALRETAQAKDQ